MSLKPLLISFMLTVLLSGCITSPSLKPHTEFRSRITDSGLKHFQVRLKPAIQKQHINEREDRPMRRSKPVSRRESRSFEKKLVKALEEHLADNQYCREGYWILDKSFIRHNMFLRGECNETATQADRAQFPDTLLKW